MSPGLWTVYRDGERWSVTAADMHEALDLAQRVPRTIGEAAIMRGEKAEHYVRVGTSVEPCMPDSLQYSEHSWFTETAPARPYFLQDGRPVYLAGPTWLIVEDLTSSDVSAWCAALVVAEAAAARLRAAKTVPAQRVSVSLYRSGKREGLPRFSREHDAAYRAQVLAAIESNAARLRSIEAEETCVAKTLECLPVLGPRAWAAVDAMALDSLELLEEQLARAWVLAEASEVGVAVREWLIETSTSAGRALKNARSVRDHGFGVGARCLLAENEHGDGPHGLGTVTEVSVGAEQSHYGPEVHVLHERLVQLDGAGEWWTSVDNLSPRK